MVWPIPLNNNHPSTGLFIKDCSEQLSEEVIILLFSIISMKRIILKLYLIARIIKISRKYQIKLNHQ